MTQHYGVIDGLNTFVYRDTDDPFTVEFTAVRPFPGEEVLIETGFINLNIAKDKINEIVSINGYTSDGQVIVDCLNDSYPISERHGKTLFVESIYASGGVDANEEYFPIKDRDWHKWVISEFGA